MLAVAGLAAFTGSPAARAETQSGNPQGKRFTHVWIFVFENTNYDKVTAKSMPYFTAKAKAGTTLTKMYGVGHASLTNYIAMASGHSPNDKTRADCFSYDCVYEKGDDNNIADQLEGAGLTWRSYMDGMTKPCAHGKEGAGEPYLGQGNGGYATRHNPFMYYRSIVGDQARCDQHVLPITEMQKDRAAGKVANYNFISPDVCHDAHDDSSDPKCSLQNADKWLQPQLDPILASKEYQSGGAVFLTFDEAELADGSSCCAGVSGASGAGGGHIATAILSPALAKRGESIDTPYSHYSLLRTVEDNFGLPALRNANDPSTASMINLFAVRGTASTPTTAVNGSTTATVNNGSPTTVVPATTKSGSGSSKLWLLGVLLAAILGGAFIVSKRRGTS